MLLKIFIIVFYCVLFFAPGCTLHKKIITGESYLLKSWVLDKNINKFISPNYTKDRKFWSLDSMIIAEGQLINIKEDEVGKESWSVEVNKYTFIDLRSRSFYEYTTFTDTAKIIDKFSQPDTGRVKGGWGFFSTQSAIQLENMTIVPDTIIKNIVYKRVKSFRMIQGASGTQKELQFGYFRCDKKNSIYKLDNPLSKKMGCPVVRIEKFYPELKSGIAYEIEFLPDKLTPEKVKIFATWKKNAKNNPVNN